MVGSHKELPYVPEFEPAKELDIISVSDQFDDEPTMPLTPEIIIYRPKISFSTSIFDTVLNTGPLQIPLIITDNALVPSTVVPVSQLEQKKAHYLISLR